MIDARLRFLAVKLQNIGGEDLEDIAAELNRLAKIFGEKYVQKPDSIGKKVEEDVNEESVLSWDDVAKGKVTDAKKDSAGLTRSAAMKNPRSAFAARDKVKKMAELSRRATKEEPPRTHTQGFVNPTTGEITPF